MIDPLGGIAKPFTVYEDIRSKLIAQGFPPEQIAFIHDANSEAKKKELFGKVRSGQIRVLLGSTAKTVSYTHLYGNYPDERAHAEAAGRDWVEKSAASTESDIAPADLSLIHI